MRKAVKYLPCLIAIIGLLLAQAGSRDSGLAQGADPEGRVAPETNLSITAVESKISYQGVLKQDGQPVNGTRNMVFAFYASSACSGSPLWTASHSNVPVTNGLFSVALDVDQAHFDGRGLWLRVEVGGTPIGCEEILPVPYALSLQPGARIKGSLENWDVIHATNTATSGASWGVYGGSNSTNGAGVHGYAGASSGTTYGVYGVSFSPSGYGGYFRSGAISGTTYGVYGQAESPGGTGVYGSGLFHGVGGESPSGVGVYGMSNTSYGVYGVTSGNSGHGVHGQATSATGGHGVYAESAGNGGNGAALWAEAKGTSGIAIWGEATGSDSTMVLEHEAGSGDFVRAFQANPSNLRFKVDVGGNVYRDGSCTSPAADFAELLPAAAGLAPGDVLIIGADGQLVQSTQPYQAAVVGVYSTDPAFLGGGNAEGDTSGKVPLAILGVVPVKASTENGPIVPGDLLVTSSAPGHAMRAGPNPPIGTVIGKALQALDAASGTGLIQMLVVLQ